MKKRLLSALLALALVFVLLPTTALADTTPVTDENVKINGSAVTVGNDISLGDGNGTYSYDKSTRTLTLNNATITATGSNIGIDFCDTTNYVTYSVILTGENTVTSNNIAIETTPNTNLTFTGGGNLKAITNGYYQAIRVYGTLTIDNSTLIAESSAYTATTVIWTLAMTGNNAKLEISNKSAANIVAGTAGPASNIDWSNYQFTTGSYSGDALTESDPEVCSWGTLKKYFGYPTKEYSQYICIAKRTIPALQRTSDVLIAGDPAVVGVETSIPSANGSGTYFYDQASKTLTLKDVNIASSSIINAIQFAAAGTYTIKLVGTNTMSGFSTGISANSADQYVSNINITVTGAGSLEISATKYAIAMNKGDLKFENTGEIKLTTSNISPTHNVLSVSGNITIADMEKYKVEGIVQDNTKDGGDTVTLSEASHLKGYQNPDGTAICLKTITITPTPAKDSTISYDGKTLKQGETIKDENGGTATVDRKNNTITLNNFKGTKALSFEATLADSTLVLEGTSTLSSIVTTQKGLTISGSGSLTVGSIRVPNNTTTSNSPSLTIDGAKVTAGTPTSTTRAVEVKGDLTVTNGSLTATSKSDSVPTVQVGGNASFTGSTVTITNHSTTQGERYKDSNAASSALHVNGAVTISGGTVTAEAKAGGNAIRAVGNITVSDGAQVTATNNSQHFSAITAGQASGGVVNNLSKLIVSGETTKITATNSYANSSTGAIHAKIKNANEGHYLQVGTGTDTKAIAPNAEDNNTGRGSITITRGDAYETPQVTANYTIAGQTMYVGKYYKTDANGNITDGTAQDYNIYCDSENDFTLNNATISSTGTGGSTGVIKTNLDYSSAQFHIKLIGTNSINNAGHHAILGEGAYSTIIIENAENASNASLTISGNFLPVYSFGNVTINAEVVIINTNGNLISTNKDGHAGAFDLDSGYKCYASTSVSGSPLETYDAAKSSTYKYLRVTKENLAPTTPTPQTPFTIYGIPAQFVDGGMIATTGVTATSSNNINLPIDRVKWYTFTPVFGSDGRMDSVSDKTEATGNFEADKYYVVEIKFVQDLSPFKSWDMKVSGWSDNDVYRQSVTARNDIEIYFLTPASAATHEHNWAENYDTVYHWKMCTYDGCTAIKDKALHVWNAWHTSNNEQQHWKSCSECSYSTPPHDIDLAYVSDGEQGHHLYCKHDGCTFVTGTTAHNYEEGSNICTDCGYNKSAPCDHTGDHAYTNNGDGTHKVTCKACGATIVEKQNHEFNPTGVCIYCGATQSGGDPTPDNPGTIVIIRPAEEEKPAQQPNPSTGANDLVGLAVAAAVAAALGSAALLRKHD